MERNILFKTDYGRISKSSSWIMTSISLILALITRTILSLAANNPSLVERFYSASIYPYIAKAVGLISGIIPFSIAELLLILIPIFLIGAIITIVLKPRFILNNFSRIFHYIVRLLAIGFVLFYLLWGFNYFREDYLSLAKMDGSPSSYAELKNLTAIMIDKSNETRELLGEDDRGLLLIEESFDELGQIANRGFDDYRVGDLYLGGNYGRVKPVFLSKYMSYTGITGIFIPFTSEPTINKDIPNQSLLSTISHEIAHQRGFAKEDEANFIAYKANINNPDKRFQYSGYYLAMNYLLNQVYRENPDDHLILYNRLSDRVKRDLKFAGDYWKAREGRVKESANKMNDNYLKANYQTDGVKSYSGVVRLLLAEYKDSSLNSK